MYIIKNNNGKLSIEPRKPSILNPSQREAMAQYMKCIQCGYKWILAPRNGNACPICDTPFIIEGE